MAWVYHSGRICGEGELWCQEVVVCVMVAVYKLQFVVVVAYGNCGVRELWCVRVMVVTKP